ncbi:hypothetical protein ACFVUH_22785 [Kitasatospora sp. NPDC058032]|uniref:hypothetical protein n=1 Tax=Kitasatospora sp. NPDC058032 TaxID=3346307 RepID=UPI0036DA9581
MTARLTPPAALAVALTASAALLPVLAVLGELRPTWVALTAYTALAAAVGRHSHPSAAPLIGLAGWLFHNGFVEHRHGTLTLTEPAAEAAHLLLLTTAALALALGAAARRGPRRDRSVPRRHGRVTVDPKPGRVPL